MRRCAPSAYSMHRAMRRAPRGWSSRSALLYLQPGARTDRDPGRAARPAAARLVRFTSAAGIDLGGTQVRSRWRVQTETSSPASRPRLHFSRRRRRWSTGRRPRSIAIVGAKKVRSIALAAPGPIDHKRGVAGQPAKPSLAQRAVRRDAQRATGAKVHLAMTGHGWTRGIRPRRGTRHPQHGLHHLVDWHRRRNDHRRQAASWCSWDGVGGRAHDHRRRRSARCLRPARLPRSAHRWASLARETGRPASELFAAAAAGDRHALMVVERSARTWGLL